MSDEITYCVNLMDKNSAFGSWFRPILDSTHLKHKAVAERAGIAPGSLSRILSGAGGIEVDTARRLARAVNEMAGNVIADEDVAALRAVGIEDAPPPASEVDKLAAELAQAVMSAGFDDLEDENLRRSFFEDMKSISESMLRRKLEEQEKTRGLL